MKQNELRHFKHLFLFTLTGLVALLCTPVEPHTDYDELAPFLDSLIIAHQVPGLSFAVFNAKIEPLDVSFRICIDFEKEIELILMYFDGAVYFAPMAKEASHGDVRFHSIAIDINHFN